MYSFSKKRVYCVFGCDDFSGYMHRFPNPSRRPELFITWLSILRKRDKVKEPDFEKIYNNKRVCDYHFIPEHKIQHNHRLKPWAVPTLHLNGLLRTEGILLLLEHNYAKLQMWPEENKENCISPQNHSVADEHRDEDEDLQRSPTPIDNDQSSTSETLLPDLEAELETNNDAEPSSSKPLITDNKKGPVPKIDKYNIKPRKRRITKEKPNNRYEQALKAPKANYFTLEDTVQPLSFYKKRPRLNSYIYKHFKLPSAKSLKIRLDNVKLSPGINKVIFEKLKDTVEGMNEKDQLVTLIFDEMPLTQNIQYDSKTDNFVGFVTNDGSLKIASRALVFMVNGIKTNFKQPIAYYFTQSLNTRKLKEIIIDVIRHVKSTGLKILCTVSDQGATNVSAINSLVKDTKVAYLKNGKELCGQFYEVDKQQIIHLYDVPRLFKGIRNNLLTKYMVYKDDKEENKTKLIKWQYLQQLYEVDKCFGELRFLYQLTEEHINPQKIKKKCAKTATEIFSHKVAVAAEHLTARKLLPIECKNLIPVVLLFDKLFDSLNARTFSSQNGKMFSCGVRRNSPHHKLWVESKVFLNNVKFLVVKTEGNVTRIDPTSVPSLKNLIKTIKGVQTLWSMLHKRYLFDYLLTGKLSLDPLEMFFGNIRSLGVRNSALNCRAFEDAFKTLLFNNFSSPQTRNTNCEGDLNNYLQTLEFLFNENLNNTINETEVELEPSLSQKIFKQIYREKIVVANNNQQQRYLCGWVLSHCLRKVVKGCKSCKGTLLSKKTDIGNEYIRGKEYNIKKQWLAYPSRQLIDCYNEIHEITIYFTRKTFVKNKIKRKIAKIVDTFVTFPVNCDIHKAEFKKVFIDVSINILMFTWCRSINRILSGKIKYKENIM